MLVEWKSIRRTEEEAILAQRTNVLLKDCQIFSYIIIFAQDVLSQKVFLQGKQVKKINTVRKFEKATFI